MTTDRPSPPLWVQGRYLGGTGSDGELVHNLQVPSRYLGSTRHIDIYIDISRIYQDQT